MANPYAPPPAARGNDRTQLWGILAIVFAFCCPIVGIVFAILQINEAKKFGKAPTLGYVAIGIAAFIILLNIILAVTGNAYWRFDTY